MAVARHLKFTKQISTMASTNFLMNYPKGLAGQGHVCHKFGFGEAKHFKFRTEIENTM